MLHSHLNIKKQKTNSELIIQKKIRVALLCFHIVQPTVCAH